MLQPWYREMLMKVCEPVEQPKTSSFPNFPIILNKLYIKGAWRDSHSGKTFPAIDPTTEAEIAQLSEGTVEDVELAVKSAETAFAGAWGQMSDTNEVKFSGEWVICFSNTVRSWLFCK
jgi:Aldehyde dehydrogenase family